MSTPLAPAIYGGSGAYGTCTRCKRNAAADDAGLCRTCLYIQQHDPKRATLEQVAATLKAIREPMGFVRWPYTTLDTVAGPIPAGQVAYVVGGSGLGKTTLAVDIVRRWVTGEPMANARGPAQFVKQPVGVTVLPLETSPADWRMALAANMAGINHGDIMEAIAAFHEGDASTAETLTLLQQMVELQVTDETLRTYLQVIEDERVTVDNLGRAFAMAKAAGHRVVLIDHIDQVGDDADPVTGRTQSGLVAVEKVNNAVLHFARAYGMVAICMSQANKSVEGDGSNPLLRYRKLEMSHVMYSSYKVKNAAQIIGIFRPLKLGITREDFALAREGAIDVAEVLAEGRMGLNALKLRHRGRNEKRTVDLAYATGRVRDLTVHEMEQDHVARLSSMALAHQTVVTRAPTPKPRKPAASTGSFYEKDEA